MTSAPSLGEESAPRDHPPEQGVPTTSSSPAEPVPPGPGGPLAWRICGALGISWFLFTVIVSGVDRFPTWDEAVYWAKAPGDPSTIAWFDHRALGVPALLSPVTSLGGNFIVGRIFVAAVLGLVVAAGLRVWSHTIPHRALAGSTLFLLGWPALFHGTVFFPNLPTALLLWVGLGGIWTWVRTQRREALLLGIAGQALACAFRPADAAWIGLGIALIVLIDLRINPAGQATVLWLGAISAVGVLPWVIESFISFDDPAARLANSKGIFETFDLDNPVLDFHRGFAGGPTSPSPSTLDLWIAAAWLAVLIGAALIGAWRADSLQSGARLALGAGVASAGAYLAFPLVADPRMMLPALAMLSIPAGLGLLPVLRSRLGLGAIAFAALVFVSWNVVTTRDVVAQEKEATATLLAIADAIRDQGDDGACSFASRFGYPQIELRTGCDGSQTEGYELSGLILEHDLHRTSYLIVPGRNRPLDGWAEIPLADEFGRWTILRHEG